MLRVFQKWDIVIRHFSSNNIDNLDGLYHIADLAATEKAEVPPLILSAVQQVTGYGAANRHLQMNEWAFEEYVAGSITDEKTGKPLEYRDLIKIPKVKATWEKALANELGRLAQGIRDIAGTNTIKFIRKSDIPKERMKDITYGRIVVAYRPQKEEKIGRD